VVINTHHLADAIGDFIRNYPGPAQVEVVREVLSWEQPAG